MALSKEANERMWDALLTEALIESSNRELERIKREMEAEGDIGDFSKEITRKIKALISSVGRKEKLRLAGKIIRKTVVAAALVISIMSGAMLTQPDVYAAVGGVIRKVFDSHDSYVYEGNNKSEFNDNIRLGYLPNDYELRSVFYYADLMKITYENPIDDTSIKFNYGFIENYQISFDNERHDYIEIKRNECIYHFYKAKEDTDWNILHWTDGEYFYSIYAQISRDEIVKIAENLKK